MLKLFGETQQKILRLLQRHGAGLTIDQLASELGIARTAVKQHLFSLARDTFVKEGPTRDTGGRPVRVYLLTKEGQELFQKQYSWFSSLLLGALKKDLGASEFQAKLRSLAVEIAESFKPDLKNKTSAERIEVIAELMTSLSYEAEPSKKRENGPVDGIQAWNCVYHKLAKEYPEVCDFDIALLEELSGQKVDHETCIVRGANMCRFRFHGKT